MYLHLFNKQGNNKILGECERIYWNNGILILLNMEDEIVEIDVLSETIAWKGIRYDSFEIIDAVDIEYLLHSLNFTTQHIESL